MGIITSLRVPKITRATVVVYQKCVVDKRVGLLSALPNDRLSAENFGNNVCTGATGKNNDLPLP